MRRKEEVEVSAHHPAGVPGATGEVDKGHTHAICSRRARGSNWTPRFCGAFPPTPLQAERFQPAASAPKLFGLSDSPSILVSRPPQPVEGGSLKLEINWFDAGLEGAAVSRTALPSGLERRELNPGQHSPARASQAPPRGSLGTTLSGDSALRWQNPWTPVPALPLRDSLQLPESQVCLPSFPPNVNLGFYVSWSHTPIPTPRL
ncbi:uncharacterized protein LOC122677733 isoform X1 [Cervus elaphus]|uniref:uncharacterized protein LOC122677733 isoform X1 n=1 Tax=Cervus elaphus TaxID=9860 RepID=UPI001CC2B9EC|nr:uncharacterized protein LOC122677733 isoform X1 [Cervus elaphus]